MWWWREGGGDARHVMSCDAAAMCVMSCHVMVERRRWRCASCHVMSCDAAAMWPLVGLPIEFYDGNVKGLKIQSWCE